MLRCGMHISVSVVHVRVDVYARAHEFIFIYIIHAYTVDVYPLYPTSNHLQVVLTESSLYMYIVQALRNGNSSLPRSLADGLFSRAMSSS